jgi:hypothetical protein
METQSIEAMEQHQLSMAILHTVVMAQVLLDMETQSIEAMALHPQITVILDTTADKSAFYLIAVKNAVEDRMVQLR